MAKKHGILLTFKTGTSKAEIAKALGQLESLVDEHTIWTRKGFTKATLADAVQEYDDEYGSPTFYIP